MIKPYREGAAWSIRLRLKGESLYRTGFESEVAARKELDKRKRAGIPP
jgi:hypothetical protein